MSKTMALDGLERLNRFSSMHSSGAILLEVDMRDVLGRFVKGNTSWLKGKSILINDALKKWRDAGGQSWNKGKKLKPLSKDHRDAIRRSLLGHKVSPATRERISFGRKHSDKIKRVIEDKHGYVLVRLDRKDKKWCYIGEHTIIAERMIGRALYKNELVHHINGIRTDNRKENLIVLLRDQHTKLHRNIKGEASNV